jgi:hypothetical protein
MSLRGPERRFAATQQHVRSRRLSRHCAEIVDLALLTQSGRARDQGPCRVVRAHGLYSKSRAFKGSRHEHRNAQSPTVEPGSFVTFLCTMSAIFLCTMSAIFIDFVSVKAQRNIDRDANAKRSVLQSNLSIGTLLSVPFVRSEACRAKGNHMRTLVEPPPSSR